MPKRLEVSRRALHPGTRILIYLLSALAVPGLNFFQLLGLSMGGGAACIGRLRQVGTLMRRARWLLLLMVITYGYSLPGEALIPAWAQYGPTREGLLQGLIQAWRLILLLLLLDVLVLRMPLADLLMGIHSLLRPFTALGVDRERISVRLALTMEAMERPLGWAGMRALLGGQVPPHMGTDHYVLTLRPCRLADRAVLVLLALGVVWLYA